MNRIVQYKSSGATERDDAARDPLDVSDRLQERESLSRRAHSLESV